MPYKTYTTRQEAEISLAAMQFAVDLYTSDESGVELLRNACTLANKKHRSEYISKTTLGAIVSGSKSLEKARNTAGYYVTFREKTSCKSFKADEEKMLVYQVLEEMDEKLVLRWNDISDLATHHRDGIPLSELRKRKRLFNACFSRRWVRDFVSRHNTYICMRKPILVEGKREVAFSADNISSFFGLIQNVCESYNITSSKQIYNLDETGFSPEKDFSGQTKEKVVSHAKTNPNISTARFAYRDRVSVLACINADGNSVIPMIVFKGSEIPDYRRNGIHRSIEELMPDNMMCEFRSDKGGINTDLFIKWVHKFCDFISENHSDNEHVLLLMDGYRAHLSLHAVQYLTSFNIVVVLNPAHCSHKLQPLDVRCFRAVKRYSRNYILDRYQELRQSTSDPRLQLEDVVKGISYGMRKGLTPDTIKSGFKNGGCFL